MIHTPYQYLLTLVTKAAKRASRRAARRDKDYTTGLLELDAEVTNTATKGMDSEDISYLDISRGGGGYDKVKLLELDDSIDTTCDYCGVAEGTLEHLIWDCVHFCNHRKLV